MHCVPLGWHTSLDQFVSLLPFVSTCRIGIECNPTNCPLFSILVYLPSRSGCTDDFKEALHQMEAIIMLLPPGADIIIMGDFNTDVGHLGGPQSSTQLNEQGKILHRHFTRWEFASSHLYLLSTPSS